MNRDEGMDRLLQSAVRRPTGADGGAACLDADLVAALSDGSVTPAERAAAEAHAAGCDRCFAILAAVARTTPPAAPAEARPAWLSVRWLVPLASAAVIVIAFALQRSPSDVRTPPSASVSQAPATQIAPTDEGRAAADADRKPQIATPAPEEAAKMTAAAAEPQRQEHDRPAVEAKKLSKEAKEELAKVGAAASRTAVRQSAANEVQAKVAGQPAPPPPPPPAAPAPPQAAPGNPATVTTSSPPVVAESVAVTADRLQRRGDTRAFQQQRQPLQLITPDSNVRWRVSGASLERSSDGGRTWSAPITVADREILAGACPAADVCWAVGRKGLILLMSDGSNWRPLSPPEASADLVAITATSATAATVTAANGRNYRTSDGGRTWTAN